MRLDPSGVRYTAWISRFRPWTSAELDRVRPDLADQRIRLGDAEICRIGLGTNRLRDTENNVAFIRAAVDAGVQMIDTAHLYTSGASETPTGRALSTEVSARRSLVVASKAGYGDIGRGKPEILRREIDQSLASLRVDRVALYYLHRVDPETPIEDSLGAIKE